MLWKQSDSQALTATPPVNASNQFTMPTKEIFEGTLVVCIDQPGALWEGVGRPVCPLGSSEADEPLAGIAGHVAGGNFVQDLHDIQCCGGGLYGAAVGLVGADGCGGLDDMEVQADEGELLQGVDDEGGLDRAAAVQDEAG